MVYNSRRLFAIAHEIVPDLRIDNIEAIVIHPAPSGMTWGCG
jgi:hypothetical protein